MLEAKRRLRQEIRAEFSKLSAEEIKIRSVKAVENLLACEQFRAAKTVLLFHSLPDEVNTHALLATATDLGKKILLPVVVGQEIVPAEFSSLENLHSGAFSILEPDFQSFTEKIDLVVTPGVAFDADGFRLGRGKGFYDRFFAKNLAVFKIGFCLNFQIKEKIPRENHDKKMDLIISD